LDGSAGSQLYYDHSLDMPASNCEALHCQHGTQ
jgi:hypothetical protein